MKRIQKGFTLVELIVVMAIMGIIMTVIMSIINPTSRIASKVESMKDEETAAISVGRAIKSELEFATKVYVVGANDGETISGVPSDFSYVYVINNSEARPNSRKGAKGIAEALEADSRPIHQTAYLGGPSPHPLRGILLNDRASGPDRFTL